MHPSIETQSQSIPFSLSYARRPNSHIFSNTPASVHSWNRRCAEDDEQIPVLFNAFHCIPVRST